MFFDYLVWPMSRLLMGSMTYTAAVQQGVIDKFWPFWLHF